MEHGPLTASAQLILQGSGSGTLSTSAIGPEVYHELCRDVTSATRVFLVCDSSVLRIGKAVYLRLLALLVASQLWLKASASSTGPRKCFPGVRLRVYPQMGTTQMPVSQLGSQRDLVLVSELTRQRFRCPPCTTCDKFNQRLNSWLE